jgi:hypothetical protein
VIFQSKRLNFGLLLVLRKLKLLRGWGYDQSNKYSAEGRQHPVRTKFEVRSSKFARIILHSRQHLSLSKRPNCDFFARAQMVKVGFGSSPGLRARRTQAERPPKSFACALRNSAAVREANELLQRHPFVARAIAADCACSQHSSRSATSLRSNILCQTTRR